MSQGKAIVYVDNQYVGYYDKCNTSVDTISNVRFYAQQRYNGGICFDNLSLSASDTSVDKKFDFTTPAVKDTDYTLSHTTITKDEVTKDLWNIENVTANGNTYLDITRNEGQSSHIKFLLPATEAEADAAVFSFRINIQKDTAAGSEVRIMLSSLSATAPYMATITKRTSEDGKTTYVTMGEKRSSNNDINEDVKNLFGETTFALDTWYTVTLKLHIGCCDEFLVEWIVTDGTTTWTAYSRNFAREHHDEIRPETAVTHLDFWAVGNDYSHHFLLDDISIKAGGAGVISDHTINNAATAPIYVSDDNGHHYKICACDKTSGTYKIGDDTYYHANCERYGFADCDTNGADGSCSVCGHTPTQSASNGANR